MIQLDDFDRALLARLQHNNRETLDEIGYHVGLSPSAVRRRVKALRDVGVIIGDVSIVDPNVTTMTVIVSIRFEKESAQIYSDFKREMRDTPQVSQCYTVSGAEDFVVIAHFADMTAYDDWVNARLLTNPAIARSTTQVVYRRVKFSTAIPME